jgi:hypothetical protein
MAGQRASWPEEAAAGEQDRQSFLLVHGGWHAAVHWNKVSERRAAVGHRACAIGLPGSGVNAACPQSYPRNHFTACATEPSPIGGIHLADYAAPSPPRQPEEVVVPSSRDDEPPATRRA